MNTSIFSEELWPTMVTIKFSIFLIFLQLWGGTSIQFPSGERDIPVMTVPELISYWGYPVEEHWVTTTDGYILGLHRIPHGQNDPHPGAPRPVVYMQHGLTSSSSSWTFGPPTKSLGQVRPYDGGFPQSDKMYLPQIRIIRDYHEIRCFVCARTQHHQREDLHHPVVLVHHPRHPHSLVHSLRGCHSLPSRAQKKPGD